MHASFAALCVCVFAVGRVPSSSADLMFDGFNEPKGHYHTTRRPPFHTWPEAPAGPSASGYDHLPHRPGHGPHFPGHGPYVPSHGHHGPRGPHGPHPGHGARTPGTEIAFPGSANWAPTTRNPPPGKPGHRHSPGWNPTRNSPPRTTPTPPTESPAQNEIPLSLFERLNEVDNIDDFFRLVEGGDNRDPEPDGDIVNRFGESGTSIQRKGSRSVAKPAHCIPENQTVALRLPADADPSAIYFPTCTRVPRCGGCCAGNIQSCQPTEISTLNVRVMVSNYAGNNKLKDVRDTLISVEQHNKCGCQCIVKQKDCSPLQRYIAGECRCECTNQDDRAKCPVGDDRLWDNTTCACVCRRESSCSSGWFFSPRSCECVRSPERKRRTNQQASETQSEEYTWT